MSSPSTRSSTDGWRRTVRSGRYPSAKTFRWWGSVKVTPTVTVSFFNVQSTNEDLKVTPQSCVPGYDVVEDRDTSGV